MQYIFIINGRSDKADIRTQVEQKLAELNLPNCSTYVTKGVGDGTRHVRIWCDLHRDEPACFVACGASGTANEVASGIMGFENKCMAMWAFGGTSDFVKAFPDRDFTSLEKILEGELTHIDAIRAGDSYAINMACAGFSAMAAYEADRFIEEGKRNPYVRGVFAALFSARRNRVRVTADGKKLSHRAILMCDMANGNYSGGQFLAAPRAKVDDGLMDVCVMRPMSLFTFLYIIRQYKCGRHLTNRYARRFIKYVQVRHVDLLSPYLITLSLDGEITAGTSFSIDVLPKALPIILPKI